MSQPLVDRKTLHFEQERSYCHHESHRILLMVGHRRIVSNYLKVATKLPKRTFSQTKVLFFIKPLSKKIQSHV